MNDNSSYDTRLDFDVDEPNKAQNHTIMTALDDVYFYTSGVYIIY